MYNLTTEHLEYRPFSEKDLPFLKELLTDDQVCKYLPGNVGFPESKVPVVLSHFLASFKDNRYHKVYLVSDKITGIEIGYVGIQLVKEFMKYEIFYAYIPQAWGKGYATEASLKMKEVAKASGLKELIALADVNNIPSQKVLINTGYHQVSKIDLWNMKLYYYEMKLI